MAHTDPNPRPRMTMPDLFWLSDRQWSRVETLIPKPRSGKARPNDRQVISGVVHALLGNLRWCDIPEDYGQRSTIYRRYRIWARLGVWPRILDVVDREH